MEVITYRKRYDTVLKPYCLLFFVARRCILMTIAL